MTKKVKKIGNSHGIILDRTLMELAHLKEGDELNLEIHPGGGITLMPVEPARNSEEVSEVIQDIMKRYAKTMKRLA